MTRRRFAPFLIGLFLLTSVIVTRIALAHFRSDRSDLVSTPERPAVFALVERAEPKARLPSETVASATSTRAASVDAPVFTLSAESSAQLSEQIELNGMAEQTGLTLTENELRGLAEVTALHQSIREAYELEIASVIHSAEGNPRLEIPLYSDAGDALRTAFYADLRDAVGISTAALIQAKVGARLESRFAGFGMAEQTIELVASKSEGDDELVLQRTAVYWNSAADQEHAATQRETAFPRLELTAGRSLTVVRAILKSELSTGRL